MTHYDEFPFPGLPSISELTDEANNCRHGRLPFDEPLPDCSCWQISWSKGRKVIPLPVKKREPRHRYPWTVRHRAIRLRAEGMSYERVAGVVGVAPNSVRRWVLAAGVERQEAA